MKKPLRIVAVIVPLAIVGALLASHPVRSTLWNMRHAWWIHANGIAVGRKLPAVQLTSLTGAPETLTAQPGHAVVINVFATWCGPCLQEMPDLRRAAAILQEKGVDVVGIDRDEPQQSVARFIQRNHLRYPVLMDQSDVSGSLLSANMIPTTIFVDRNERVRGIYHGPLQLQDFIALGTAAGM